MTDMDKMKEDILKPDAKLKKFDDHGLTDDYLINKLKDQCEAEVEVGVQTGKKEWKTLKKPLWKIQQDAVKEANKLKGNYPAEKHEHTGDVIFHSNVPEPDVPEKEEEKPSVETKETREHPYEDLPTHEEEEIPIKKEPEDTKDHHRSRREAEKKEKPLHDPLVDAFKEV